MKKLRKKIQEILNIKSFNKIYIIGKGPSLSEIDKNLLKDGIVINLNDSERYFPGDFSILHSFWAYQSISANNFASQYYLSDREMPQNVESSIIPFVPNNPDNNNNFKEVFDDSDFVISDFLFISAIKLSSFIAKEINKKIEIVFLGFDFGDDLKKRTVEDYSGHSTEFANVMLKTQEDIFIRLKNYAQENITDLKILHVGQKEYSDISFLQFNQGNLTDGKVFKNNFELYQELIIKVNNDTPIVVAELTNNHIGDENRLRKMVRMSKEQGADVIKVQKRDVDTFYTADELKSSYKSPFGDTLKHYRAHVELTDYLFDVLIEECKKNEIFWFASVLDKNSYEYMLKYDLPLLKLPSTISNHRNYLKHVADTFNGDIVVSTGFTDVEYENFVLESFNNSHKLYLMQCTSSYPAPPDSCNIGVIQHYSELKKQYENLIPGYSSHDVGSLASQIAVGAGALILEKHVKLGDLDWVHFDGVALDIAKGEFGQYVKDVKLATVLKGSKTKKVHSKEHHKYKPNVKNN